MRKLSSYLGIIFFIFSIGCGSSLVQEMATPSISQILPQPIPAGAGDTTLTVVGANFNSQTVILWNNSALATTPVSSSTVSVAVPAARLAQPGTVNVQVQNGSAGAASVSVPLAIVSPNAQAYSALTIAPPNFASGVVGTSYSTQLTASGGTTPYKWSISSGSLPTGLTLAASTGVIAGTPTVAGSFSFGITVTDSEKTVVTASVSGTIVIAPSKLAIKTTALAAGTNGEAYSQDLLATGGTPAYSWSVSSGTLPAGLTLAASTGVISGTPTVNGTFALGLTVKDSGSPQQTVTLATTILLAPKPVTITTSSLASGIAGTAYSQTLAATGGTPNYNWTLTSGSLPTGLSLSTSGVISGTPWTSGTFSFGVTVTDSGSPALTNTTAMMLTIAPRPLAISTDGLAVGNEGVAYSQMLAARGGTAPYIWSLTAGSTLPPGLTLASSGLVSGIPTAGGGFDFGIQVADSSSPQQTATLSTLIVVSPSTLAISTSSLTSATVGTAYSQTLTASGGTPSFRWSITSGALPAGLSLSSWTGVISGTPTVSGAFTLGITVMDRGNPQQTATTTLSLTVVSPVPPLVISTSALPSAAAASSYSATLTAAGGTAPYAWSVSSGSLPAGLSLASSGVISGTPAATGAYPLGVTVTDSCKPSALSKSASLTLVVTPSALIITNSALATGTVGVAYSQALAASGGTPAYTWDISAGSLPAGLSMAATTGVISGTPTTSGTTSFTATVTDNGNPAQTQSVATSITVAPAVQSTGPGTTWYIRVDGGTRYSANQTSGQCDGKGDAAYPGTGTNQHCAFNDFRFLWDDQSYQSDSWVIAGGDTVIIRGCAANPNQANPSSPDCRIGFDSATGPGAGYTWCFGGNGPYSCSNPPIPSGTPTQHTRILGQNYASCSTGNVTNNSALTQIFGGFGVSADLNLSGAKNVDIQCLEITQHNSQCILHGSPAYPRYCTTGGSTMDDYNGDGIQTSNTTSNVSLQDVYIHGNTTSGIAGPIGGLITMTRVFVGFNGFAGWNFDDGSDTPDAAGSVINANYVTMEGNGCNEEYPIVHTGFPAKSCYDLDSGGFGDSWSGQDTTLSSFTCNHCSTFYNTKDGFIGPHTATTNLLVENSTSYGNMGQQWKWGATANSSTTFINNTTVGNCDRMNELIPGAAQNFNQATGLPGSYLTLFCRASGDVFSFYSSANSSVLFANNTVVAYSATVFDMNCGSSSAAGNAAGTCGTTPYTFTNNIILGLMDADPNYGSNGELPGLYYYCDPSDVVTASHNIEYNIRNGDSCTGSILCLDPLLTNEPPLSFNSESALDNLNFSLSSASPAIGSGIYLPSVTLDYTGAQRSNPPSIGAYEK